MSIERSFSDGVMAAVRLPGISLIRVESGKFAEIWDQSDQLSLLTQLGVIQLPGR